jgi:hypothetical protein
MLADDQHVRGIPRSWQTVTTSDPAAGSPTATLLRLLLSPRRGHWADLDNEKQASHAPPLTFVFVSSVATTGGVYKWQGQIPCWLMTSMYKEFHVHGKQFQTPIPSKA